MRRFLMLLVMLAPALAAPGAFADDPPVGSADRAAIHDVVADQLAAFQRDDGTAAFSFASPNIRAQFGTVENFMTMVKVGYPPVYRPREVSFGAVVELNGRIVQRVLLVGPDGQPVMALYIMQQQPDGSWRIDGCILTQSDEKST
jgi:Domain of unknown function (DUF4864)